MHSDTEIEVHGLGWINFRRKTVEVNKPEVKIACKIKIEVYVKKGVTVVDRKTLINTWGNKGTKNINKVRSVRSIKVPHRAKIK